ncbi:LacI family DNA-binding transcriptional regulator [Xylophilus sp. GOD-11R]|uniref:LacI family DNA-binding transcriptional regulator n=1 Tax=Xylophilus sp. GOD-11R TaxID=3089814 RepID=UPI00298C2D89|nr:LacI family DNA-binding transcriptional regulator [Xylophilus sp. GOD-11R]WPB55460.1 LacI family DNA-binding transcriptional regulator [Xylophilus sp. GOD-11R]
MKAKVTAHDVARLANVSQSAVSRSFTAGASVAPETRERIHAAARSLGYRPNAIARSLITRRSHIIGLVMSYLENQFYPLVIERLSQALQREGYHVLLFISETGDADAVLADILQYQVDGIVMASTTLSSALAQDCAEAGIPVVLFNRVAQMGAMGRFSTSSVTSRNREGGALVGELLVRTGHRRIAWLAGLENASTSLDREAGLTEALQAAGLALHARAVGRYDFGQARRATLELFSDPATRPDAVFAANDHMAIAVLETLRRELGLNVPQDVSVVGFDNVPQAAWPSFDLTTVQQDVDRMVDATRTLLFERLGGEVQPRSVAVPCVLVERGTVADRA